MLSIGGDNLQFYPNFAQFSTLGGIKLDYGFFHVSNSSEDQKKKTGLPQNLKSFCPRNKVKTKNKRPKIIQRSDVDHSQIIGDMQSNYWEGYITPPGVGTPDCLYQSLVEWIERLLLKQ